MEVIGRQKDSFNLTCLQKLCESNVWQNFSQGVCFFAPTPIYFLNWISPTKKSKEKKVCAISYFKVQSEWKIIRYLTNIVLAKKRRFFCENSFCSSLPIYFLHLFFIRTYTYFLRSLPLWEIKFIELTQPLLQERLLSGKKESEEIFKIRFGQGLFENKMVYWLDFI